MKRVVCLAVLAVFLVSAGPVFAMHYPTPEKKPEISGYFSFIYLTDFISRGIRTNNGGALQPNVGLVYEGFKADFWADYDTEPVGDPKNYLIETDFTFAYGTSFDKLYAEVGYIYEAFGPPGTQELYASLTYETILSPSLTYYQDIDNGGGGGFAIANITHSFDLGSDMSLGLNASASYNFRDKVYEKSEFYGFAGDDEELFYGFHNGTISGSLTKTVTLEGYTDHPLSIAITPNIGYSFPLSNKGKDAIEALSFQRNEDDTKSSWFYGGVNVGLSF
jgi:hypothetical protein